MSDALISCFYLDSFFCVRRLLDVKKNDSQNLCMKSYNILIMCLIIPNAINLKWTIIFQLESVMNFSTWWKSILLSNMKI